MELQQYNLFFLYQETFALTKRLFIQLKRRPSTLLAGILQPIIWLFLFGALFSKAPEGFLPGVDSYGNFLGAGLIVFTAFSGALNSGLPLMFDREFGLLNRLLVAPLASRLSIVLSSFFYITVLSLVKSIVIIMELQQYNLFFLYQETFALTKRLFIQLKRRPSTLLAGILQPIIWLFLFGALFSKAPEGFLPGVDSYGNFLGAGLIVFTAFSGALNSGLPLMFDREFGFLNRLLVAPLTSRLSIVLSSFFYITILSFVQSIVIMIVSYILGYGWPNVYGLGIVFTTLILLVLFVTSISLCLAFVLPGHIELIALIFVINLPLLFASTALAPISFMPNWLGWLASLNPLTFAIEPIRTAYTQTMDLELVALHAPYGDLTCKSCVSILFSLTVFSLIIIRPLLNRKLN